MSRVLRDAAPAAAIAVAAIVLIAIAPPREPPAPAAIATEPVDTHVLDGLVVGDRIAGWSVAAIAATADGGLDVTMQRDGLRFVYAVVPLGTRPENPPFQSDAYAIYYGHATPAGREIPAGALRATSADLLRRLERVRRRG